MAKPDDSTVGVPPLDGCLVRYGGSDRSSVKGESRGRLWLTDADRGDSLVGDNDSAGESPRKPQKPYGFAGVLLRFKQG